MQPEIENDQQIQEVIPPEPTSIPGTIMLPNLGEEYPELVGLNDITTNRFIIRDINGIRFVQTDEEVNAEEYINELKANDSSILFVQPDYTFSLSSVNEGWAFANDENIDMAKVDGSRLESDNMSKLTYSDYNFDANINEAHKYSTGTGSMVAVIDTAMDISHEQIFNNIYTNENEVADGSDSDNNGYIDDNKGWNFVENTNTVCEDDNKYDAWHATAIAGIITASAPEAKIMPLKVFDNGRGYTSDIIRAIDYAKTMGVKIINCSWNSDNENPMLKEMMSSCTDMIFVCAAGNDGSNLDESPVYPASYELDNILTVASINKYGSLSTYSNYSKTAVDITAPGEDVLVSTTNNQYGETSGTSIAAAFVSGAVALDMVYTNDITRIKNEIVSSGTRLYTLIDAVGSGSSLDVENIFKNEKRESYLYLKKKPLAKPAFFDMQENSSIQMYGAETQVPSTESGWQWKGTMPTVRDSMSSVAVDGMIYMMGGMDGASVSSKTEVYNTQTNTWIAKTNMPRGRYKHAALQIEGKIYICGGYNSEGPVSNIDVYNIQADTWETEISTPNNNTNYASAIHNKELYIFSGKEFNVDTTKVYKYNLDTDRWVQLASMPKTAINEQALSIETGFYVFSNWDVLQYNVESNSWKIIDHIKRELLDYVAISRSLYTYINTNYYEQKDQIFVTGGKDLLDGKARGIVRFRYQPDFNQDYEWFMDESMIRALYKHNTVQVGNYIYVLGGLGLDNTQQDRIYRKSIYDYPQNTYSPIITENKIFSGSINDNLDVDRYKFTPSVSGKYEIKRLSSMHSNNPNYSVYLTVSLEGKILCAEWPGYLGGIYMEAGKTYSLDISDTTNQFAGNYTLKLVKTEDDAPDTIDEAVNIPLDQKIDKTFLGTLDKDYMYFDITHTGKYDFSIITDTYTYGGQIYLHTKAQTTIYNANKEQIYQFENDPQDTQRYQLTPGRYYICLKSTSYYDDEHPAYSLMIKTTRMVGQMAHERAKHEIVPIAGNTLYALGGVDANFTVVDTIEKYDENTKDWNDVTNIPNPKKGTSSVSVGEKIYIIGGYSNGEYSNTIDIYDTQTNTWSDGGTISTARERAAISADGSKIYIAGGRNAIGYLDTMEIYDVAAKTTQTVKLPDYSMDADMVWTNNKLYLVGGVNLYGYTNKVYAYENGTWRGKNSMPYILQQVKSSGYDNGIISVGSVDGTLKTLYYNAQADKWVEQDILFKNSKDTQPLQNLMYYDISLSGNKVYLIGGSVDGEVFADIYSFDVSKIKRTANLTAQTTIPIQQGQVYPIAISVQDIQTFEGKQFAVTYDSGMFEVSDLCGQTWGKDTQIGQVSGSDIIIVESTPGRVVFETTKQVQPGKQLTGVINVVELTAMYTGSTSVAIKMQ